MLDVYVSGQLVGVLDQPEAYTYVFNYLPDAPSELPVSLLMPKRTESWIYRELHPVFQISLPEGALRELITKKFGKRFEHFGDLELLEIIGENMIGRIQVVPHGQTISGLTTHESLSRLIKEDTTDLVKHYLGEKLQDSGVSGGFIKFLAKSPINRTDARTTLTLNDWIIKLNDDDHPHIVLIEYFGMMAAKACGLDVPEIFLSEDHRHLLVKRFDITSTGERHGFEDMCSLLGLPARDKFTGSVERIIKTIQTYCQSQSIHRSLDLFLGQYLFASTIRNGDAHLKNFGLIYNEVQDVQMAPTYDMLSMSVYAPSRSNSLDADDGMAINFEGSKRWLTPQSIRSLASKCEAHPKRLKEWEAQIADALVDTSKAVITFLKDHPSDHFESIAKRMLILWSIGLEIFNSKAATAIRKQLS